MIAAHYDILLDRASDWSKVLTIRQGDGTVVDLSDANFRGRVRDVATKSPIVTFAFDTTGAASGLVTFGLDDTATRNLLSTRKYEYDIFMSEGSSDIRLLEGTVTSRDNITL